MKKLLLLLLTAVVTCSFAWSQTTETLTTNQFWPKGNQYDETYTSTDKFLGSTWSIKSLSNNNNNWTNIRCGNKSTAYTASIYNNSAISDIIKKKVVNVSFEKSGTNDNLNSAPKLYVSDSSSFPTASTSTYTLSSYSAAGDWTFEVPEQAVGANKFYKLEFDCKKSSNNGWLGINSLTFYKDEASITKCATPTFSVENNTTLYAEETVTINCDTPGATIMYSVNDDTLEGEAPITISFDSDGTYTIEAIAMKDGLYDSDPAELAIEYNKNRPAAPKNATSVLIVTNFSNSSSTSYGDRTFEDIDNGLKFAAQCAINNNTQFQFRSSNNNSGLIVTTNIAGYKAKKITIEWATTTSSGRIINFYGSNAAYSAPSDLYSNTTTTSGTQIGSLTYSSNKTTAEIEFTDETKQFPYIGLRSNSGALYVNKITIEWELPESTAGKEDAELSFGETDSYFVPFGGEFDAPALVNPNNVAVTYSSEKESVATVDAEGKVSIKGIGTTTIKAEPVDKDKYYGSASYTLNVQAAYSSIAEMLENASDGDKLIVNTPLTVGYAKGSNIYVTDGKGGYMLVYSKDNNYEALDVIHAGWSAEYAIYNGLPELKPVSLPAAGEKGEYEIVKVTDPAKAALSQIVEIEEVVFGSATETSVSANFTGTINGKTWQFRNTHGIDAVEAGKYRVTLIASTYGSNATEILAVNQLLPLKYEIAPAHPAVKIDSEDIKDGEDSISLDNKEKVVVEFNHEDAENHVIFHKFVADAPAEDAPAAQADDDNDGFVEYTEPIEITQAGTLHYYAQHKTSGTKSEVKTIKFTGVTTTAIAEIAGAEGASEYFDLQGRRVAANAKGIVIKKTGSKVSKVVF